jgi:alkylated DNA repair dioxygenase AlkB
VGDDIIASLDKLNWCPLTNSANSRLVQHYGYKYNYYTKDIHEKCDPFPKCLNTFVNILDVIIPGYVFNQCIVNNYYPAQGISAHIDIKSYGNVIACFTVGSGANMTFEYNTEKYNIYAEKNSLYIMSGDARYKWKHSMSGTKYDIVNDVAIPRDRRISLTFRNVP